MKTVPSSPSTQLFLNSMLVIGVLFLLAGYSLGGWIGADAEWILFVGRLHPVVLHVPIGLYVGAVLLVFVWWGWRERGVLLALDIVLGVGAVSASLAAALGFCLVAEGGYAEDLLERHQLSGLVFCVALLVAVFWRARGLRLGSAGMGFGICLWLLVAGVTMVFAGHLGGSLTHGSNYLTRYAPAWLGGEGAAEAEKMGEVLSVDNELSVAVFEPSVRQIFEDKCFSCHGPEKQKGDYRMDDPEALLAGGESGLPAIVAGRAMESFLAELISLPKGHDELMPPEGKSALTDSEILLILRWIHEGADLEGWSN